MKMAKGKGKGKQKPVMRLKPVVPVTAATEDELKVAQRKALRERLSAMRDLRTGKAQQKEEEKTNTTKEMQIDNMLSQLGIGDELVKQELIAKIKGGEITNLNQLSMFLMGKSDEETLNEFMTSVGDMENIS